jgi:hypothetical protein
MEWVLKLEAKTGWGEVETIEVGRLERRVVGLTAEEVGLTLSEGKGPAGRTRPPGPPDPDGRVRHLSPCVPGLYEAQTPAG